MDRRYRVRDFARITGVTVKALQHYDRIGLLKPTRTPAGHRIYCDRDIERVQQIVALKAIGIPLKQIRAVLDRHTVSLADALKSQRAVLAEQRSALQRALNAIAIVEADLTRGQMSDAKALAQLIDLLTAQGDVDAMRQYFSPEAWAKFGDYWVDWPPPHWRELFRDADLLCALACGVRRRPASQGRDPRGQHESVPRSRELAAADAATLDGIPLPRDPQVPGSGVHGSAAPPRCSVLRAVTEGRLMQIRSASSTESLTVLAITGSYFFAVLNDRLLEKNGSTFISIRSTTRLV